MNDVYKYLKEELLQKDDVIVAAISGGPDSMALLSILLDVRKELPITIVCAHVNHNVREVSMDEKLFVESFCKEHDVIFEYYLIEQYHNDNFHQDARKIRYQYFEKLIAKYCAQYLFTAHHGDDLMETMLMRMVRGSILRGYAGFPKISKKKNYWLVRPLIHKTKIELEQYDRENGISYVIDHSNEKDVYTRNRFRKYILPVLKKENLQVHHKFYDLSEELLECSAFIEREVAAVLPTVYENQILFLEPFSKIDRYLKRCVLEKVLEELYTNNPSILKKDHVLSLLSLIEHSGSNMRISLPEHITAIKSYENISFVKDFNIASDYDLIIQNKILLPNGHRIEYGDNPDTTNFSCRLLSSELTLPLRIRNRRDGDIVFVKGLNGKKKLKDIFIDEKIPMKDRNEWPVLVDSSNQVLWVPGLKKTKFDKPIEEKYDIILRYY